MKYIFDVGFTPKDSLKDHDCRLVVDLLRASSQVVTFFEAGGEILVPASDIEKAFLAAKSMGPDWKLMGEEDGLRIDGFDYGNSPFEFLPSHAPKYAVMVTTNGTPAFIRAARDCAKVIAASARNAEAAAWDALLSGQRICVLCAGHCGRFSMEDTLCAGMLIEKMLKLAPSNGGTEMELTDAAVAAMALWHHTGCDLTASAFESEHGIKLNELGFSNDIYFCTEIDAVSTVPILTETEGVLAFVGR